MLRMRRQNCYSGKCSEFNQSVLFVLQTIVNQVHFSNPTCTQGAIVYARKDETQKQESAYAPCLRFPVSSCPIFSQSSWPNFLTKTILWQIRQANKMSLRSSKWGWKWMVAENLALKLLSGSSLDISLGSDDIFPRAKQILFLPGWRSMYIFVRKEKRFMVVLYWMIHT